MTGSPQHTCGACYYVFPRVQTSDITLDKISSPDRYRLGSCNKEPLKVQIRASARGTCICSYVAAIASAPSALGYKKVRDEIADLIKGEI